MKRRGPAILGGKIDADRMPDPASIPPVPCRKTARAGTPPFGRAGLLLLGVLLSGWLWGCAVGSDNRVSQGPPQPEGGGVVIDSRSGAPIGFAALIERLAKVRVVYVGEEHTNPAHHRVQLEILQALFARQPDLAVGMEMFDRSYQPVLDQWSAGGLDREEFIRKTHWYANWRFKYDLYADILDFIRENKIRLVGLNLPFHIPPKIRIGGVDSLQGCDAAWLPRDIDTGNAAHRAYLESAFNAHHGAAGTNFEFFYQAQCVWEDVMAEAVAANLDGKTMLVFAGNGHIFRKFGIPDRAFKRTGASFRTVYPLPPGRPREPADADFFWVAPEEPNM